MDLGCHSVDWLQRLLVMVVLVLFYCRGAPVPASKSLVRRADSDVVYRDRTFFFCMTLAEIFGYFPVCTVSLATGIPGYLQTLDAGRLQRPKYVAIDGYLPTGKSTALAPKSGPTPHTLAPYADFYWPGYKSDIESIVAKDTDVEEYF
ncbi:hypothetical protein PCH_Pc24g02210 [Penicillium rubens Wisconsin 54-1255]|uniref:Uncharacterized protein n=1 Tax=Penicillium rubens (strain ATCC 28089 / DSM 1075 / NRRL 1951 / Wisconsin 54-1255) TaxID=500485 RepID=B6HX01_PENRW|nr:hypothetical protein PCH_Pc24g02210 [Penicillium rubens Wisconsin 54-1255]